MASFTLQLPLWPDPPPVEGKGSITVSLFPIPFFPIRRLQCDVAFRTGVKCCCFGYPSAVVQHEFRDEWMTWLMLMLELSIPLVSVGTCSSCLAVFALFISFRGDI
ncbi:hypothetical protein NE237_003686 [Protea cynaroides]|uniref:Uncharacterized protein n=1 Tax=Protea cynaroides TaxID=273540 RepID=A0A9Q0QSV5_9MAGN|nr:hypothetical protein NE237_003686 [Protea cynaroides]